MLGTFDDHVTSVNQVESGLKSGSILGAGSGPSCPCRPKFVPGTRPAPQVYTLKSDLASSAETLSGLRGQLIAVMDSINVSELVERLGSDEDAVRKMAVFKLQSNIGDPSFADIFMLEGGLNKLRDLVLHATGNTLAYSLTSFARLLEVDKGWEDVNHALVERVC